MRKRETAFRIPYRQRGKLTISVSHLHLRLKMIKKALGISLFGVAHFVFLLTLRADLT